MLKYLDNARNVKAHPNENYARELMELFTLGIGNYTEQDVRESARAFTGWTFARQTGEFSSTRASTTTAARRFSARPATSTATTSSTSSSSNRPPARWFCGASCSNFFVYNDPEPELVASVRGDHPQERFQPARRCMSTLLREQRLLLASARTGRW